MLCGLCSSRPIFGFRKAGGSFGYRPFFCALVGLDRAASGAPTSANPKLASISIFCAWQGCFTRRYWMTDKGRGDNCHVTRYSLRSDQVVCRPAYTGIVRLRNDATIAAGDCGEGGEEARLHRPRVVARGSESAGGQSPSCTERQSKGTALDLDQRSVAYLFPVRGRRRVRGRSL